MPSPFDNYIWMNQGIHWDEAMIMVIRNAYGRFARDNKMLPVGRRGENSEKVGAGNDETGRLA